MKANGLIERVTDDVPKAGMGGSVEFAHGNSKRYFETPPLDIIGLQRLVSNAFTLYQSTHKTEGVTSGIIFPYAWELDEGDKVYNSTTKEEYTIKNPQPLARGYGDPFAGEYPDIQELKPHTYRFPKTSTLEYYPDIQSREEFHLKNPSIPPDRGEVGFVVTLIDKNGKKVRPTETDVLLFKSHRYMKMFPKNRMHYKNSYVPDPENDRDLEEVTNFSNPNIVYSVRRCEPSSRDTNKFGNRKSDRAIIFDTVGHPSEPNIQYRLYSQYVEFLNRYDILTSTKYDSEKAFSYLLLFFQKHADIFRLNGVRGLAFWQALPGSISENTDNISFSLDMYFKVQYIDSRIVNVRRGVTVGAYKEGTTKVENIAAKSAPVE